MKSQRMTAPRSRFIFLQFYYGLLHVCYILCETIRAAASDLFVVRACIFTTISDLPVVLDEPIIKLSGDSPRLQTEMGANDIRERLGGVLEIAKHL